jgi:hypothetical protein
MTKLLTLAALISSTFAFCSCATRTDRIEGRHDARTSGVEARQDRYDTRAEGRQDRRQIRSDREDARAADRFDSW